MVQLGSSGYLLEKLVGFLVWAVANGVYLDMKRDGVHGFRRFLAFWLGTPTTWLTLLFVKEGSAARVKPPPDDEEALLARVREDRRLRRGEEEAPEPTPRPTLEEEP